MQTQISIGAALKKAWCITAKNWLVLVGLFLTYYTLLLLFNFLFSGASMFSAFNYGAGLTQTAFTQNMLYSLLSFVISGLFTYIYSQVVLDCVKGIEPRFKFSLPQFGYYFLALFVIASLSIVGMLMAAFILPYSTMLFVVVCMLLTVAYVYLSIRIQFFVFLIIDKNMKPLAAIKRSWEITKQNTGKLILLILLELGILMVGILALFVGILYALPLIVVLQACVYEQMENRMEIISEL